MNYGGLFDTDKIKEEIMNLHTAVYEKFNYEMKFMRPPKGEFNERTLKKNYLKPLEKKEL